MKIYNWELAANLLKFKTIFCQKVFDLLQLFTVNLNKIVLKRTARGQLRFECFGEFLIP